MRILCRFTVLFKLAFIFWLLGLAVGFWAGQHVATASIGPAVAASRTPFPESPGWLSVRGGEFQWSRTPTW
jgi:hypothetical protein